nr:hypothetical protein [Tanacetum cinerariifolium]
MIYDLTYINDEQEYDEEEYDEETRDEESFDPILKTPENSNDEGNGEEDLGLNVGREQGHDEKEDEDELYRDLSSSVSSQFVTSMLNPTLDVGMESIFETTSQMGAQTPILVAPLPMIAPTLTSSTIATITTTIQSPTPPTTASSTLIQDLPNFGSLFDIDNRLRTLEANFSEFITDCKRELEAKVLTRSSHSLKTSYAVAADLSEMELKKILIEKMEGNKSIQRSDEQRNLYKALVKTYESDKIILDTYGKTVTLKKRCDDDADKDEEPSVGPDRGSKRRREGKEPESASAPKEKATMSAGKSTQGTKSRQASTSESAIVKEPMQTTFQMEEPSHLEFDIDTLTPKLIAGPIYELLKGSCKSLVELEYNLEEVYNTTTDQLDWVNPEGASSRKYMTSVMKTKAANYGHIKWIKDLVPRTMWIEEPIGYDNHAPLESLPLGRKLRRDDDKVYKFKEGDFKRLRFQDIEDMLLLLVQGKLTNLTVKECFAFNHKEAYTAYSNPRGFIYQNKDKKNKLMRIDELHKFSDGTLTDVRTTLDDHHLRPGGS